MPTDTAKSIPGQSQALWMSTIAFTVCFAVWTIFAIIGVQIKQQLNLSETQFGLLVGTPILTGSLIRLALGIWTDQYGGRVVYTMTMLAAAVATFLPSYAQPYPHMLLAAPGVGIAGGGLARLQRRGDVVELLLRARLVESLGGYGALAEWAEEIEARLGTPGLGTMAGPLGAIAVGLGAD